MANIPSQFHSFTSPPKIISGVDSRKSLGAEIKNLGGNVVLVCTHRTVVDEGLHVDILDTLSRNNLAYIIFDEVDANPTVATVEQGVKTFRNEQCDILLAVGDSNVIDAAKAISYLVSYTLPANCEKSNVGSVDPPYIVAIPTSFGIGAGVLGNSIMYNAEKGSKNLINIPVKVCREVILDPVMLQSMSLHDAALSGMVTLAHAIEGFVSSGSFELTNLLNFKSIQLIAKYIRPFIANRKSIDAAMAMQNAYLYSALGSINSGLGNTDAMAKSLYVHSDINYRLTSSVALPVVMEFNAMACPEKFIKIAECFGENINCLPPHEGALKAVDAVKKLARDIGIPDKLDDTSVTGQEIEQISKELIDNGIAHINNPRETSLKDIINLYKKIFGQRS